MPTKTCSVCHETKDLEQFARKRRSKDGRDSRCHGCMKEYIHRYKGDPSGKGYWKSREARWKAQGISLPDGTPFLRANYHQLLDAQGGGCALCGRYPPMWSQTLAVDHNAKSGIARGLLCDECNQLAVGKYEKWGHFTSRPKVNDRIRAYLENPPMSRLSQTPKDPAEQAINSIDAFLLA